MTVNVFHLPASRREAIAAAPENAHSGRTFLVTAYCCSSFMAVFAVFLAVHWLPRWNMPATNDFGVFYAAGKLAGAGNLAAAYSSGPLYHVEALLSRGHHHIRMPFPYAPFVGGLLGILAHLPLHIAYDLWSAANLVAYVLAGVLAIRRLNASKRLLAGLCLAGCLPIVISIAQGENSGLLALGLVLTLVGFERPPALPMGLVLLSLKPQLLVVPIILILLRRRRVELLSIGGAAALLGLAGLLAGGISAYLAFLNLLRQSLRWTTQFHWGAAHNYSLLAQLHGFLGYGILSTVLWVTAALATFTLWRRSVNRDGPVPWLPFAALTVLLANHLLFHDLAILYPAAMPALATRLRWTALLLLISPWIDPALYSLSDIHVVVASCLVVLVVAVAFAAWEERAPRTIEWYQHTGGPHRQWKSFALPRWGSVSGSGTRST